MKSLFFSLSLLPAVMAGAPALVSEPLVMDNEPLTMTGSLSGRLMVRSGLELALSPTRPAGVKREPAYRGTPLYATLRFGNGPRADTIVVVDRAPDERREENRLYIDVNQNGDLTDDGDGQMQSVGKSLPGARVGPHFAIARASWGVDGRETATADFGFMCLIGADRGGGQQTMMLRTAAVRVGTIAVDGQARRVALVETRCDGLFDVAQARPEASVSFTTRGVKTMTLLLDINGDGEFGAVEVFDACLPIQVGATTYEVSATPDGARVTLTPTDKPAQVVKPRVRAARTKDSTLLGAGTVAPDFTVERFGGGTLKLSDLRGKTVVLDFWATWCIPCIRSMPHVQKTIAKAKGGEIVWLGVCVWDDRPAFDRWVPANDAKYNFTKVFDPAAKDKAASIAGRLYKVTGIPTLYVIDREGRIVEGLMGYLGDDDDRLAAALAKAAR